MKYKTFIAIILFSILFALLLGVLVPTAASSNGGVVEVVHAEVVTVELPY